MREKRLADRAAAQAANSEYNKSYNQPHYYVPSAMNELLAHENVSDYTNEFPEASTSPLSSGISVEESSSAASFNSSELSSFSFAQALKHENKIFANQGSGRLKKLVKVKFLF